MIFRTRVAAVILCGLVLVGTARSFFEEVSTPRAVTQAAHSFIAMLKEPQKAIGILPYETPTRVDWHFIPKRERKGLEIGQLEGPQKRAAMAVVEAALSQIGYDKARQIMRMENLLRELEGAGGANVRDPERYFLTFFGKVGEGRWGLSFEGHHLSLNFVMEGDRVVSSTPQAFAANPAIVKTRNQSRIEPGARILESEETLAFDLVNALSDEQKTKALIAEEALKEVRNAGQPQPPNEPPAGIPASELKEEQQAILQKLVKAYCDAMPEKVAAQRLEDIKNAGWDGVHFAWAGATEPGIGHYYRVQGPTFLIEFVNTQPDAAGNIANHIHSLWRDMRGDFALPITGEST